MSGQSPRGGDAIGMDAGWQQPLTRPAACDHIAQVYQDEAFLAETVAHFVGAGLWQGDGVLVIAAAAHWEAAARRLESEGVDLESAQGSGQLVVLDAAQTLSRFMSDGTPDPDAFNSVVGTAVGRVQRKFPAVRAFGEMVDLLWREGNRPAAARLEELWNNAIRLHSISLFCAYHMDPLDAAAYGGPLEGICHAHTHLIPTRHYERLDRAVTEASHRILDESMVGMLQALARLDRLDTQMPFGQAVLLWLGKNMPVTAERVLLQARAAHGEVS